MSKATAPVPAGMHTVTPHLISKDAAKAIEFYKKAFGAEQVTCLKSPDGRVMHGHVRIGDSHLFVSDEFPEHGCGGLSPASLNNFHATIHLFVADVDQSIKQAVDAGATIQMP